MYLFKRHVAFEKHPGVTLMIQWEMSLKIMDAEREAKPETLTVGCHIAQEGSLARICQRNTAAVPQQRGKDYSVVRYLSGKRMLVCIARSQLKIDAFIIEKLANKTSEEVNSAVSPHKNIVNLGNGYFPRSVYLSSYFKKYFKELSPFCLSPSQPTFNSSFLSSFTSSLNISFFFNT